MQRGVSAPLFLNVGVMGMTNILGKLSRRTALWIASATVAGMALTAPATAATLINGDFESVSNPSEVGLVHGRQLSTLANTGSGWDVYDTLPGWETTVNNNNAMTAGIEIQTNRTLGSIDAHSGQHYVELDSHPNSTNGNIANSSMLQELTLDAGSYLLSFYYSPRTNTPATNGIRYKVLGSVGDADGFVTGPSVAPNVVGQWHRVEMLFDIASNQTDVDLIFSAGGTQDTLGGFIDTVAIAAVPLPAGGLLLITGLGALGFARRRKKA